MAISRDAVIWGFRFFLGREIESEPIIQAHMNVKDENTLAEILIKSREFSLKNRFSDLIELRNEPKEALKAANSGNEISTSSLNILMFGNCQARSLGRLVQAMTGNAVTNALPMSPATIERLKQGDFDNLIAESDLILLHPNDGFRQFVKDRDSTAASKIKYIPRITFPAFHPDAEYVFNGNKGTILGPLGEYHSSLVFYAWKNGFDIDQAIALFNEDVFEHLGFFDYWHASRESLINEGRLTNLSLEHLIDRWSKQGEWMYSMNHPKLFVLADLARAILAREGIVALPGAEKFVEDELMCGPVWPLYPEIGRKLGISGHYQFKKDRASCPNDHPILMLGLENFVRGSFESFEKYPKENLICSRLASTRYQTLGDFLKKQQILKSTHTPIPAVATSVSVQNGSSLYRGLPDHQFWRRGVERLSMKDVDPVVQSSFTLDREHKVATAGSCFAQHISRTLQKNGFNFYVTESGDQISPEEALQRNFGVFSARYGNVYTARQLLQLLDRAYGAFVPLDHYWVRSDGKFVDPFRPQIEPDGFASIEELELSRKEHFLSVRQMFENLDVLVFTLGLTEAWRNKLDGAVYPLAPGVVAGEVNPAVHEFVNFCVSDVVADMNAFIQRLLQVNPRAKILVTVSPVPLIATYENRHVLVSTTYSKSVLRAAAEEIIQRNSICEYFPSYEVITGNYTKGEYFEADLRSVKPDGVDHVMRLFMEHYSSKKSDSAKNRYALSDELMRENALMSQIVCDEEAIDNNR